MSAAVYIQTDSGDVRQVTHSKTWGWIDSYAGQWRKAPEMGPRHWRGVGKGSTRWAVQVDVP